MSRMVFNVTAKEAIFDMKEFCRLNGTLTYIGRFAKKETSEVISGDIIQYGDKLYTTGLSGVSSSPADTDGMVETTVSLFETKEYVPEECKSLSDCSIRINIWDTNIDTEAPFACYAFYDDELDKAKKFVNDNEDEDIDIFVGDEKVSREEFLEK